MGSGLQCLKLSAPHRSTAPTEGRPAAAPGASPACVQFLRGALQWTWTGDHVREGTPLKGTDARPEANPTAEATLVSGRHLPGHAPPAQERVLAAGSRLAMLGRFFRLRSSSDGGRKEQDRSAPFSKGLQQEGSGLPRARDGGEGPLPNRAGQGMLTCSFACSSSRRSYSLVRPSDCFRMARASFSAFSSSGDDSSEGRKMRR